MDFATTKLPRTFKSANQSITEQKKKKKKKKQQILTNTKGLFGMAF